MAYRSLVREGVPPRYFLISTDRKLVKGFPSHWTAKRFAKKHSITGFVARELGTIDGNADDDVGKVEQLPKEIASESSTTEMGEIREGRFIALEQRE